MTARITSLRIPAFKSVREGNIHLGPLTLLVGRNGSGKSNVLDALAVLAALASGTHIRDALDGTRQGPLVRGGSEGCAPVGENEFSLGCTVSALGSDYHLDVRVSVRPSAQIVSERLWTIRSSGSKRGQERDLLVSDDPQAGSGDLVARWDNEKRGLNPPVTFRATQLLTSQISTRVPATSDAGRKLHRISDEVLSALRGVFILDPVPHRMREFVPAKDVQLRRAADNLSAVIGALLEDSITRESLVRLTSSLSEAQLSDLSTVSSELGDVMVAIKERMGSSVHQVPARLMSDGTLRFLAIVAALLEHPDRASGLVRHGVESGGQGRLVVVEEIENGLHPSQAALLLDRLRDASKSNTQTLATTHSPALLDALDSADHDHVVVCYRSEDGWSRATSLTAFPDYLDIAGRQSLSSAIVKDRLRPGDSPSDSRSISDLLGL